MQFNALIYSVDLIEQEIELKKRIAAGTLGVRGIVLPGDIKAEALSQMLTQNGVQPEECLYLTATETEEKTAKSLAIATLPYLPKGRMAPESFSKAWMVAEGFADADADFFKKAFERAHNLPWTVMETERCIIREFSMEDMEALFALYGKPEDMRFVEPLLAWEEEKEYEEAYISNMYRYYGYGMWLVCKKDTGEVIGRAGLEHREYNGATELEMGYLIAKKERQKGYATEVCRALIDYAEEHLDFFRINCLIQKENDISLHLAEKLGFALTEEMDIDGKAMLRYTKCCFFKTNKI